MSRLLQILFLLCLALAGCRGEKPPNTTISDSSFRQAVRDGNVELVQTYLDQGYDVNSLGMGNENALHEGILNHEMTRFLIAQGISVNQQNRFDGYTPLIVSCIGANISAQTVRLLLESGADPNIKDRDGKTAFDYASALAEAHSDPKHGYQEKLGLLRMYMKKSSEAQQHGAGQPATRPVDEPEGGDKPQPEAEGRSR
jgi:hypothetical protein